MKYSTLFVLAVNRRRAMLGTRSLEFWDFGVVVHGLHFTVVTTMCEVRKSVSHRFSLL